MTLNEARSLQPGDEVHWTDPDGGLCSRDFVIAEIHIQGDERVSIVSVEGDDLEAYPRELEFLE